MNRGKNVLGEDLEDCCTDPITGFLETDVVARDRVIWDCTSFVRR